MYCGAISKKGPMCLVRIDGTITAMKYRDILFDNLLPYLEKTSRGTTFMQDNAAVHTAHAMKDFFYREGTNVLDWPAKSPDLNPIENLWGFMDREVERRCPVNLES